MTQWRLREQGDSALTLELGRSIDDALVERVHAVAQAIVKAIAQDSRLREVSDVVCGFATVSVHFDPLLTDVSSLSTALHELACSTGSQPMQGRTWRLPLCMDERLAPDVQHLCEHAGLSAFEVGERLQALRLRVCMIGFMPGFAYMSGVPQTLAMPRLAVPRKAVAARSVAIAGSMCGVYPFESPGGWNLIGRTPVLMFDPRRPQPSLLAAADTVCWQLVGLEEYGLLEQRWASGKVDCEELLETQV